MDTYNIKIPTVDVEKVTNIKYPNLTPLIFMDTDNNEVSVVIISADRAIWFSNDGLICQSDLAYFNEPHIKFIRAFQPGDELIIKK